MPTSTHQHTHVRLECTTTSSMMCSMCVDHSCCEVVNAHAEPSMDMNFTMVVWCGIVAIVVDHTISSDATTTQHIY